MANYKGLDVAAELVPLIPSMDAVETNREALQRLQGSWDHLAMLADFSGTGIELAGVRSAFEDLSATLIDQLAGQTRRKAATALHERAHIAIDILVRNLFERTADIGFLATDAELRRFAEVDADTRERERRALVERMREYQRSYSVYDDIVLLDPAGTVLARLGPGDAAATGDAFVATALAGGSAYVEAFGRFALWPERERSLVYAQRVLATGGQRVVGVLCLSFRFDDECRRVFESLREADDWRVLALADADGRVIASSDALQLPPGAVIEPPATPGVRLLRFAGRRWLATHCTAHAYQGYGGPGWFGLGLVPLDVAFEADTSAAAPTLAPVQRAALSASPLLFADGLRAIPRAAGAIEADLRRAVWNGHIALCAAPAGRDSAFSKVLLREIGRTGARTREVFTQAIADLDESVVSALLDETGARAALAIEILDRNLYERSNDCRWWALTGAFRAALEAGAVDAATQAALVRILQTIHGLYTVYANLVLFDRDGRVVAASRQEGAALPGARLDADWVGRTLALADTQAWSVSAFEPSPLYGDRPTLIYGAAVRGRAASRGAVVGGLAIVFDAAPQFEAMLVDTLPRTETGAVRDGAFNAFVDADGRVLASSPGGPAAGTSAGAVPGDSDAIARIVERDGRLWAFGQRAATGYREYRGRCGVWARCLVPLADVAVASAIQPSVSPPLPASSRRSGAGERLDLASFTVGGQWYALHGGDVVEAVGASERVLPLRQAGPRIRGSLLHGGRPLLVVDLSGLLGHPDTAANGAGRAVVIVRGTADFPSFGIAVDALGDNFDVEPAALQAVHGVGALIDAVVRPASERRGEELLRLLSLPAIAAAALGARVLRTA